MNSDSEIESDDINYSDDDIGSDYSDNMSEIEDDIIDIIDIDNDNNDILKKFENGINPENICSCDRVCEIFFNCSLCNSKCCIHCSTNSNIVICSKCDLQMSNNEKQVIADNKCDSCNQKWNYQGTCSCHPELNSFKTCKKHTIKCSEKSCHKIICDKNLSGLCDKHNVYCEGCSGKLRKNDTKKTCIKCNIKSCYACVNDLFPLKRIDNLFPDICKNHFPETECQYCHKTLQIKCFDDNCNTMVCYNCEYIKYQDTIKAYCWRHRGGCDWCNVGVPRCLLKKIPPFKNLNNDLSSLKLCSHCYDIIVNEYKTMCLVLKRLNIEVPRDVRNLIFEYACKGRF